MCFASTLETLRSVPGRAAALPRCAAGVTRAGRGAQILEIVITLMTGVYDDAGGYHDNFLPVLIHYAKRGWGPSLAGAACAPAPAGWALTAQRPPGRCSSTF
jgi:hypothetical protein